MSDFKCNLCDSVQDTTDWVENFMNDGDEFEVVCSNCHEDIQVSVSIEVSYDNLANRY